MTQPPNLPPPPPPPGYTPPPAAVYVPNQGYVPPAGYGATPGANQPGHGRVSPTRLIAVFVAVLVVGLAIGAVVILAFQPAVKKPDCPDPSVQCGAPPVVPTLPPIANASPTPAATPAATIVRPPGSFVIPTPIPSVAATSGPSASATTAPSGGPSVPPVSQPPTTQPPIANLPQPRPASNAEPLTIGTVWTSSTLGYQLTYDDQLWTVENENGTSISLSAGRGAVLLVIEGFKASSSTKSLVQQKINVLANNILGLAEETDPTRQLPGRPIVGHRQGVGLALNGTINQPSGPQAPVDVIVIASTDNTISIRVTLLTTDDLREPAFAVVDSVLNSIHWPGEQ